MAAEPPGTRSNVEEREARLLETAQSVQIVRVQFGWERRQLVPSSAALATSTAVPEVGAGRGCDPELRQEFRRHGCALLRVGPRRDGELARRAASLVLEGAEAPSSQANRVFDPAFAFRFVGKLGAVLVFFEPRSGRIAVRDASSNLAEGEWMPAAGLRGGGRQLVSLFAECDPDDALIREFGESTTGPAESFIGEERLAILRAADHVQACRVGDLHGSWVRPGRGTDDPLGEDVSQIANGVAARGPGMGEDAVKTLLSLLLADASYPRDDGLERPKPVFTPKFALRAWGPSGRTFILWDPEEDLLSLWEPTELYFPDPFQPVDFSRGRAAMVSHLKSVMPADPEAQALESQPSASESR